MTRAPSWVRIPATVLLPAPIPPVSPMIGAAIAAVAIPTRAASRGSPRPRAIETRSSLPHEARQPPPSDRIARGRSRVGGGRAAPGLPASGPNTRRDPGARRRRRHDDPVPLERACRPRPRGPGGGQVQLPVHGGPPAHARPAPRAAALLPYGRGGGARRSPARAALGRDRGQVAGRPDRLLRGRRRRPRARPPLPRLPPAPRRPPGAAARRPPPGHGAPDAVRAGHARRPLRPGAAPPSPRPAAARDAPHHRGGRPLLPRPAPRGTNGRRGLGGDRRRRRARAARAGRVAAPRGGGPGSPLPILGPRARLAGRGVPPPAEGARGTCGGTPRPATRAWTEDRERRPRPLARGAPTPAAPT